MSNVESWPQPMGCDVHGDLPGALKAHSTMLQLLRMHEGKAEISPFQHLSSLMRSTAAGQGGPNPPVLSGRAPILGSCPKEGWLEPRSTPREAAERLLPVSGLVAPSSGCWQRTVTSLSPPRVPLQPGSPGPWGPRWSSEHQQPPVPGPPGRRSPGHRCHLQTGKEHREVKGSSRVRPTPHVRTLVPPLLLHINGDFFSITLMQKLEQRGPNVVASGHYTEDPSSVSMTCKLCHKLHASLFFFFFIIIFFSLCQMAA